MLMKLFITNEEFHGAKTSLVFMKEYYNYFIKFWSDLELAREPQQIMVESLNYC